MACDEEAAPDFTFVATHRTLELGRAGTYELEVESGIGVFVMACQREPLEVEPSSDFVGDVLSEHAVSAFPTFFESGATHSIRLEPGTYRFTFQADEELAPEMIAVELARVGD